MARRRSYHRMTPARRAALRKAQAASARKRKRSSAGKRVARGIGVFTGLVAARQLNKFADNPFTYVKRTKREYQDAKQSMSGFGRKFKRNKRSVGFTIQSGPWV